MTFMPSPCLTFKKFKHLLFFICLKFRNTFNFPACLSTVIVTKRVPPLPAPAPQPSQVLEGRGPRTLNALTGTPAPANTVSPPCPALRLSGLTSSSIPLTPAHCSHHTKLCLLKSPLASRIQILILLCGQESHCFRFLGLCRTLLPFLLATSHTQYILLSVSSINV